MYEISYTLQKHACQASAIATSSVLEQQSARLEPRSKQPLDHPFAYALIRLDGADVPMLHAVDAGEESRISVGSRVRPRWAAEPVGGILDLACFELEEEG